MSPHSKFEEMDDFLQNLLETWKTPGIAVFVIKDNQVIYSNAVGYRDIENKLEMTTDTIQPIASCTKAFTSAAIAMLVDEGKLEWNKPIRNYIPEFNLKDEVVANRITIVDMLSHRSGLPRHDFVWMNTDFTYGEVLERLPHLDLSRDMRTNFQYNNLMYLASSIVIERLSGMSYNEFIKTRIFKPLEMNDSYFSIFDIQKEEDHAKPYKERQNELIRCDFVSNDEGAGAGCINSSINDMSKWMLLHLSNGKVDGKLLVSADNLKQTHNPVFVLSTGSGWDTWLPKQKWLKLNLYALGWGGYMYRGYRVVSHSGGIDGSSSLMSFIPDEGIAVGVIVNKSGSLIPPMFTYMVFDKLLGLKEVDWHGNFNPIREQFRKMDRETGEKSLELRIPDTKPTFELHKYTGKYQHPGYGIITIDSKEEDLIIKFGDAVFTIEHYHYDTFQFDYERFDIKELLTFQLDSTGEIEGFTIKIEALTPPVKFERLPDEQLSDKVFLKKLIGTYELATIKVKIALKDENTLTIRFAEQPINELIPARGSRFKLKNAEEVQIKFIEDEKGNVSEFMYIAMATVAKAQKID